MKNILKITIVTVFLVIFTASMAQSGIHVGEGESLPSQVLPKVKAWALSEDIETYKPESLFEYINGAAEIYLAYEFKELLVAQFKMDGSEANISVEIYDMGTTENAFGIYGAERYPENNFIPTGIQGYIEDEALNFLADRYYVKLLCFDCGDKAAGVLNEFSRDIVRKVGGVKVFPELLSLFPKEGLIANSEKFSLRNFMGYSFFSNGFIANYSLDEMEFDCFAIRTSSGQEAEEILKKFLERKKEQPVSKETFGFVVTDKYYHNIFLAQMDNFILGVMKIKDGQEDIGIKYLKSLVERLKAR
ncbi:DUF6599 family protein [Acidobacteriota bacterium]